MSMTVPVPFSGSEEERRANQASHNFQNFGDPEDGETRCFDCDCRPSHTAADYPCGAEVPRREPVCDHSYSERIYGSLATAPRLY